MGGATFMRHPLVWHERSRSSWASLSTTLDNPAKSSIGSQRNPCSITLRISKSTAKPNGTYARGSVCPSNGPDGILFTSAPAITRGRPPGSPGW
jgi:hypothetical protein